MRKVVAAVIVLLLAACGKIEIDLTITGGDGHKIRLDADRLEFKLNRLVDAGVFHFRELRSGNYRISVIGTDFLEIRQLQIKSPPVIGTDKYDVKIELPVGANVPFEPSGTIVYASTRTNVRDWDLFVIQADGSQRRQLTRSPEFEQHPEWSPDGRHIAYSFGDVNTNIDLWIMDEHGGNPRRLTEHPERDEQAAWSPDGQDLAFVSHRDGDVEIWLMDDQGGNKRKLVQGREPSWAPDGRHIVFTSSAFDGNDELYVVDIEGGNRRRLTDNGTYDWFGTWSADGRRLVFSTSRYGGQELMLCKADGSGQTRITIAEKSYEQEPVWSPDGRGLAYVGGKSRDDKDRLMGTDDIFLISAVGFDLDDVDSPPVEPVNLTGDRDRHNKSPSWRSF